MARKKELLISENPKSMFAEAIKTFTTNVDFINNRKKIMLFTSPESGDGKSFISANTAVAYAERGKKILIIDCDLRKGRQHSIFKTKNLRTTGFSSLILNYQDNVENKKKVKEDELDNYITNTEYENIDIITRGPVPPNPVELLSSYNIKNILNILKKKYDVIILDCPPIIGLSDTIIMTRYSDQNILVIKSRSTKNDTLEKAKNAFEKANAKIAGVVINRALSSQIGYSSYYSNSDSRI